MSIITSYAAGQYVRTARVRYGLKLKMQWRSRTVRDIKEDELRACEIIAGFLLILGFILSRI